MFLLTILRQVYVDVLWFHGLIWSNNFQISFLKIGIVYKNCSSEFPKLIIKFDIIRFVLLRFFFFFKMWSCWEWNSLLHPLSTGCTSERLHQLLIYRMNFSENYLLWYIVMYLRRNRKKHMKSMSRVSFDNELCPIYFASSCQSGQWADSGIEWQLPR